MGKLLTNLYGRQWANQSDGELTWSDVDRALMQEIRDGINRIANRLDCHQFIGIPSTLKQVERNTDPKRLRRIALERRRRRARTK